MRVCVWAPQMRHPKIIMYFVSQLRQHYYIEQIIYIISLTSYITSVARTQLASIFIVHSANEMCMYRLPPLPPPLLLSSSVFFSLIRPTNADHLICAAHRHETHAQVKWKEIDLNENYYEWKFLLRQKTWNSWALKNYFGEWHVDGVKSAGRFKLLYDSSLITPSTAQRVVLGAFSSQESPRGLCIY